MGRNRLAELQSLNPESKNEPDLSQLDMDETKHVEDFLNELDEVRSLIDLIKENTEKISEKHSQKLSAVSETQSNKNNKELDELNAELNSTANKVRNKLKRMDKELKERNDHKDATFRIHSQQHSNVSRQFFDAMTAYNDVQVKFKQKYRERVKRQYRIVNPNVTDEEIDEALKSEAGDSIFAQQILSPGHQEAKKALEEIKDRHEEIIKLEKSIRELHQMFLDMAMLIEQQGEMLDHIEFNVGEAEEYTAEAKVELVKATEYNRAIRKKKIVFALIILLIIIIVAVVLYLVLKK